ncbi:MAG TPA: DoxX family protein [Polyangiales bacterium]
MTTATRHLPKVARYTLGAAFTLFGLNGFFQFLPAPPPAPAEAMSFLGALLASGYMFPLIKGTEVVAGLLLLGNRFVPLALALLAPIVVNIVAYHAFLAPAGMVLPLLLLAAELYAAWAYRAAFAPMLRARVEPAEPAGEHAGLSQGRLHPAR